MKKLNNNGIEIHTRSTFLQGLLLSDLNKIPNLTSGKTFLNPGISGIKYEYFKNGSMFKLFKQF